MPIRITVLGAGVVGLTTTLHLSLRVESPVLITVVAKHLPGDEASPEYTSPAAGANFFPMGKKGSSQALFETKTWRWLSYLAENVPAAGIHFQDAFIKTLKTDIGEKTPLFADHGEARPWWADVVRDFKVETEEDGSIIFRFRSVVINPNVYLPWLQSQCMTRGVQFIRGEVDHVADAAFIPDPHNIANIVINATGLQARYIKGVEDQTIVPIRGQVVVVREGGGPMFGHSSVESPGVEGELSYSMTRPHGGGTVIGGCFSPIDERREPDPELAARIIQRVLKNNRHLAAAVSPEKGLSIIRQAVAFRPQRAEGARVGDPEVLKGVQVLHNYGHGGWGYQGSWGSAEVITGIVNEWFSALRSETKGEEPDMLLRMDQVEDSTANRGRIADNALAFARAKL